MDKQKPFRAPRDEQGRKLKWSAPYESGLTGKPIEVQGKPVMEVREINGELVSGIRTKQVWVNREHARAMRNKYSRPAGLVGQLDLAKAEQLASINWMENK